MPLLFDYLVDVCKNLLLKDICKLIGSYAYSIEAWFEDLLGSVDWRSMEPPFLEITCVKKKVLTSPLKIELTCIEFFGSSLTHPQNYISLDPFHGCEGMELVVQKYVVSRMFYQK
jgi:hypothetical protein